MPYMVTCALDLRSFPRVAGNLRALSQCSGTLSAKEFDGSYVFQPTFEFLFLEINSKRGMAEALYSDIPNFISYVFRVIHALEK